MRILIQVPLAVAIVLVVWRVLSGRGQRHMALRRLGFLVFALVAVYSILFPAAWSELAHLVGVGRGTDLILYGLVVAFCGWVVAQYRRTRDLEIRYTKLARRLALDEAFASEGRRGRSTDPLPPNAPPTDDQ